MQSALHLKFFRESAKHLVLDHIWTMEYQFRLCLGCNIGLPCFFIIHVIFRSLSMIKLASFVFTWMMECNRGLHDIIIVVYWSWCTIICDTYMSMCLLNADSRSVMFLLRPKGFEEFQWFRKTILESKSTLHII